MLRKLLGVVGWLGVTALGAAGCASGDDGGAGGSGAGGSGGAGAAPVYTHPLLNQECAAPVETAPCAACEEQHCCDSFTACVDNAECGALQGCLNTCTDSACWDQCHVDHAAGVATWGARVGCVLVFCMEQGVCNPDPLTDCDRCHNLQCGDAFVACSADAACYLISQCVAGCAVGDQPCAQACIDANPAGAQLFDEYTLCLAGRCADSCN